MTGKNGSVDAALVSQEVTSTLDKLNLSMKEIGRFEKAFKDPEFLKLFEDYARDVHDPATRAETDTYLEQLEQENRIEQVYGQGTQLIIPSAEFVVKTWRAGCNQKVFLNICSSNKVWHAMCVANAQIH
jgi:dynein assembly factor 2, axonemal